jgi:hypothetical protein
MQQDTINSIVKRLEVLSNIYDNDSKITRFVDVLPSNSYIRTIFLKKFDFLKYAEGKTHDFKKTLLQGQFRPLSDILYLEVPTDYTFVQHSELAYIVKSLPYNWVVYSPIAEYIKNYYAEVSRDGDMFYNEAPK